MRKSCSRPVTSAHDGRSPACPSRCAIASHPPVRPPSGPTSRNCVGSFPFSKRAEPPHRKRYHHRFLSALRLSELILARSVKKSYRVGEIEVPALQGVDLRIEAGEMVAVMGPSGCGKTTLLNCLSGLDDIDSGEILIDGKKLHEMDDEQRTHLRAHSMGFIFQSYNLLPV